MKKFISKKYDKGFTLVETLISIAILSSIVALMVVMSGNRLNEASALKENLISEYLGQEAIETVRNLRDTYYLSNTSLTPQALFQGFVQTVSQCSGAGGTACSINAATLNLTQCSPSNCAVYLDPVSGYYGDNLIPGMKPSQFNRYITIVPTGNDVSLNIQVTVENKNAGSTGNVRKDTIITDQLWAWQ